MTSLENILKNDKYIELVNKLNLFYRFEKYGWWKLKDYGLLIFNIIILISYMGQSLSESNLAEVG
jgi:hypothetical protein